MGRRLPGPPPVLPGYTHVRALGTGGFADVFLYEQSLPRRRIAVKVLLTDAVPGDLRSAFLQETNTLAHLATHPHVLTMYEAGIAADGRPYLVTEHCPTGFGDRFRRERLSITEVLSIGIGIGAALHTAHGAGVLHRDIKPANIMQTEFGRPVLADFGIAATLSRMQREDQQSVGLSVPWAAPEMLDGHSSGSVASEVWSFGATLYALLAGRSPFEKEAGPNDRRALARRIMGHGAAPAIDRPDAPAALLELIAACLEKNPAKRPQDMHAVLRRLQLAETQLGLRPSRLELASEQRESVRTESAATAPAGLPGTSSGGLDGLAHHGGQQLALARPRRRTRAVTGSHIDDATQVRPGGLAKAERGAERGRRWVWITAACIALTAALVTVLLLLAPWERSTGPVKDLRGRAEIGAVVFTWKPPSGPADAYEVRVDGQAPVRQEQVGFTVRTATDGERVCLSVAPVIGDGLGQASELVCARSAEGR